MQHNMLIKKEILPRSATDWLILLVLCAFRLMFLIPVYVMVCMALKSREQVSLATMWSFPTAISGAGILDAWRHLNPNIGNSLAIALWGTVISAIIGSINGYLFSKWRFKGSNVVFNVILCGMFVPFQSVLIPLVKVLQNLHLYGTIPGLVFVHVVYGIPTTTLIFRDYFANIPKEMMEAARVHGAGVIRSFTHVMLPLAKPAFVVVGIFQFTNIWNDFLFGLTILPNPKMQPVTVALNNLSGTFSVDWNVVMGGAVIVGLPTTIVYVVLGRFFVQGLMAGSVKG
jgi:glucose/mannose transport system permease protein